MITYTMTRAELLNEISEDCMWIDGLREGIAVKYRKKLNPKTAKEGHYLLGITNYITPRNNKVTVAWVRVKYGKYVTIESMHYFEYTAKLGNKQYINPCYKGKVPVPDKVVIYSGHALQRLRERADMSLTALIEYETGAHDSYTHHFTGKYEYKGEVHTMFNLGDKGMFITGEHEWGVIAITFVRYDMLGEAQEKEIKECIEKTLAYGKEKERRMIANCKQLPRYMARKVVI